MFKRAFIEQRGMGRNGREETMVAEECQRLEIEVVPFTAKQIHRRQLPLSDETFICGDMVAMHGAMKQLGIEVPIPDDFPAVLEPFLKRRVWRSTVSALEAALDQGRETFAKPAGRSKVFTGRVFGSPYDRSYLSGISRREPIWCSEVVDWISEYRVYVIESEIVSIDYYWGDRSVPVSLSTVQEAVKLYSCSGKSPVAYGIDFGVLSSGETALVEANDGYALGAYSINATDYTRLLLARWRQLLDSRILAKADSSSCSPFVDPVV